MPEPWFSNSTTQEGRNTLCLGPQGHCRLQGHVDAVLVPCHAVVAASPASSASCCLLLHPVPWGKGAEPCQGWRPRGCHLPRAPSPIFHLWPLRSGHMPLHQLLQGIQDISSSPYLLSLAKPSSPREETLRGQMWESGQGLEATETTPHNVRCVSRAPLLPESRLLGKPRQPCIGKGSHTL